MKKILFCLLAAALFLCTLSACGSAPEDSNPVAAASDEGLRIVATTFPQYDWTRELLGEKADEVQLSLLLDNSIDLHSYQPSVEDIANISSCDMFIYVGGESDGWVSAALETAENKDMVVINLLEVLGDSVKEEEIVEGMEHDHAHDHGEIHPEDIQDRPLSDWQGSWITIEKALESGALDEYAAHTAQEGGMDAETQKTILAERWQSDYADFTITETGVIFNGTQVNYHYIGYEFVESDHGAAVWYGFESEEPEGTAPRYIAFNDHKIGDAHAEEHTEEDGHHEVPHYHMRYGSESLAALVSMEGWAPTYFLSDATETEIAETMSGHGHSEEHELDEHVWLSLQHAQTLCSYISEKLAELDTENAALYQENAAAYIEKLAQLDADYAATAENATVKTLLFGDRFPFRYLTDDYNLSYYAAFSGCSAETEASFETIVFLADKLEELKLPTVMVIETSDQSIANTIIENTDSKNQQILVLDSMQSVTARDISAGVTYLSIMEANLDVLKSALS